MAVYKLTAKSFNLVLHVRAPCAACARAEASISAGSEGRRVWRDSDMSDLEMVDNPEQLGYSMHGRRMILKREFND